MNVGVSFKINDWPIRKFLLVVLSLHFMFLGSIFVDMIGLEIPLLRAIICFIYLSFIPGAIILRIINLYSFGSIENFLYSVGLSISTVFFTGWTVNVFSKYVHFSNPMSIIPLTFSISVIIFILCIFCYFLGKDFPFTASIDTKNLVSIPSLLLYLFPILTIIGTYLMNFYGYNFLLMIVIFLISVFMILVYFDLISTDLYPLAILTITLSLLLHNSLISRYISGWDIQTEYYFAKYVITNYIWDPKIYSNINSMLSIVMLAPIYSIFLNIDLNYVFKIVYPILYSFLPLGIYKIILKQTTDKIAFMSVFFFISFFVFYTEMLQLARQQIAEYFFMLIVLLIVQNRYDPSTKILLLIFSFSLIVSHYGLSYIVVNSFIFGSFILFLYSKYLDKFQKENVNFSFTLLLVIFLLSWYIYISNSSVLYTIVHVFDNVIPNFISDFLNPEHSQGIYIITKNEISSLRVFAKFMHIFTQVCISTGLFYSLFQFISKKSKFNKEYLSLSLFFYIVLIASIAVPNFANLFNTSRLYQISLILLAPFCIIGGIFILKFFSFLITIMRKNKHRARYLKKLQENEYTFDIVSSTGKSQIAHKNLSKFRKFFVSVLSMNICSENSKPLKLLALFFAIFLLFNTGWIYEVLNDSPTSYSLNNNLDSPKFTEKDVIGKDWLYRCYPFDENKKNSPLIYADYFRFLLFKTSFESQISVVLASNKPQINNSYVYYATYNTVNHKVLIPIESGSNINTFYYSTNKFVLVTNKIYDNGGANIYKH